MAKTNMTQNSGGIRDERFTIKGTLGRIKTLKQRKLTFAAVDRALIEEGHYFAMTRNGLGCKLLFLVTVPIYSNQ